MKILAEDLHRLCYNAQQFSHKDSSLGGVVMFAAGEDGFALYASDDYVAMKDEAPGDVEAGAIFYLGLKEVKELEKWLRDKEGHLEIILHDDEIEVDPVALSSLPLPIVSDPPDFSSVVEVIHSEPNPVAEDYYPASREPFAIRGERFTKFRLLKTPESPSCKDGYPVDFKWDGRLLRWKCGPFLLGVVGPLARHSYDADGVEVQGIKDLYRDEPEVLW